MYDLEFSSESKRLFLRWCRFLLPILIFLAEGNAQQCVRTGADLLLEEHSDLLLGKRVGLITNQTGRLSSGQHLKDALVEHGVHLAALFTPEHGLLGVASAGESVGDQRDSVSGVPVYSLYGKTRKPTPEMLKDIDLLIYDLQDVGVRFYTFISTLGLTMEAATEQRIPFVVLDRPNPLGGLRVEGPLMEDSLRSFLGMYPIPIVYGLTCGELALMIVGEGWIASATMPELIVITMEGWRRTMTWSETRLPWIPPSPNIPDPATTFYYPATCLVEATNLSEGRGTGHPFRLVGAPFVDASRLAQNLETMKIPGVTFEPVTFTPHSSKHAGETCGGIMLTITSDTSYRAVETGLLLLEATRKLYPDSLTFDRRYMTRLLGSTEAFRSLKGESKESGDQPSNPALEQFKARAHAYQLYH